VEGGYREDRAANVDDNEGRGNKARSVTCRRTRHRYPLVDPEQPSICSGKHLFASGPSWSGTAAFEKYLWIAH
jgi:hypothetical protein